ncbi:DUF2460 domain-containing protein [Roseateles sp. DC23W]|uniref:DUF2460 domain-containing protein n=1 Tax=Pelomonas dachongensis TaxID=3299029 RepID=A0ABW7EMC1_9BURK
MSTAVFPKFAGLSAERTVSTAFSTRVQRAVSGRRAAMGERIYPVWTFSLRYNFLRASPSVADVQALRAFFRARRGALDPFYFRDETNNAVVAQTVGLGELGRVTFPLVYNEGGTIDRVGAVDITGAAPVALVNGTPVSATFGRDTLTLASAAAPGATVAWTGAYFYHVAFADDKLDLKRFLHQLFSADGLSLETVNQYS